MNPMLPQSWMLSLPGFYSVTCNVAGYCATFDDLPDSAKQETIQRTRQKI